MDDANCKRKQREKGGREREREREGGGAERERGTELDTRPQLLC